MPSTATQPPAFRWDLEWRSALFVVLLVPLFLSLGFWQLDRAEEKREIGRRWDTNKSLPAVPLSELPAVPEQLAFRRVSLSGELLEARSFLLDNRMRDGRYGVEVLTPLKTQEATILVNRGWLEGDRYRQSLPEVPAVGSLEKPTLVTLEALVYIAPGESYTLGTIDSDSAWPRLVQALDIDAMSAMLGQPLWPWSVRLVADSPMALLADWPLINVRPEKHTAYAVQWFAMAFTLAAFGLWRSTNLSERRAARKASALERVDAS